MSDQHHDDLAELQHRKRRLEHELAHAEEWATLHPGDESIRQLVNASAALDDLLEDLAARSTRYPALLPNQAEG